MSVDLMWLQIFRGQFFSGFWSVMVKISRTGFRFVVAIAIAVGSAYDWTAKLENLSGLFAKKWPGRPKTDQVISTPPSIISAFLIWLCSKLVQLFIDGDALGKFDKTLVFFWWRIRKLSKFKFRHVLTQQMVDYLNWFVFNVKWLFISFHQAKHDISS